MKLLKESELRALLEDAHLKGFNAGAFEQHGKPYEVTWDDTGNTDERDDYIDEVMETV